MINKSFLLLAAVIALIAMPFGLNAANDLSGRWTLYPAMGPSFSKIVETPDKAYTLSNGKLSSRATDGSDEVYIYSSANKLSDSDISDIFYNRDGKYLLICYSNGNLDMLSDDGRVANMPDIKDAVISSGRGINDVSFAGGRIYLATDFGLVVYDENKQEVVDSGIYNRKASHVFPMGDRLLLMFDSTIWESTLSEPHYSLDSFRELVQIWNYDIRKLSDTALIFYHSFGIMRIDFTFGETTEFTQSEIGDFTYDAAYDLLQPLGDGSVFTYDARKMYIIGNDGVRITRDIPQALLGSDLFCSGSLASVWSVDKDGYGRYDLSGDTPAVLMQPSRPDGLTVDSAYGYTWSNDGNRLYIVKKTPTIYLPDSNGDDWNGIQLVNVLEPATGTFRDITVYDFDPSELSPELAARQRESGWKGMVGGAGRVLEDPDDPEVWYQTFNGEPAFVFRGNEPVAVLNNNNCYDGANASRGYVSGIDRDGNLWLGFAYRQAPDPSFYVLPAAKRRGDLRNITKSDFIHLGYDDFSGDRDFSLLFCKHSRFIISTVGNHNQGMLVIDTNGTPSDFSDDRYVVHKTFTDTEGHAITDDRLPFPVEDHNGAIWIPSDNGPLVINNPAKAFDPDFAVRRPIVPRNDGTNFGDYLLDGIQILSVAVDPSNRKWLSTATDGVYLVSEDGTEILRHFTAQNSPLTSNTVYFAASDPHSNKVFFGTKEGLFAFDSDSSPAAEDYSDVYAYPNPVRPDYTGWITIAGLKDNSLVKIADIAGNVFFQGRSEGGMISWDGCNSAGERVRTGVYFVFASENESGSSTGAVTKIMVVN